MRLCLILFDVWRDVVIEDCLHSMVSLIAATNIPNQALLILLTDMKAFVAIPIEVH